MRLRLFITTFLFVPAIANAQQAPLKIELHTQPASLTVDPHQTALIVVDMQNDFGAKGGMFDRAGIDIEPIRAIVPKVAKTITAARASGIKVTYLKMGFQPDLSDIGPRDGPNYLKHQQLYVGEPNSAPDGSASRILIRDTWDTEIVPELKPTSDDIVIWKHRFSGFHETDLDSTLKRLRIRYLIFAGATTSVCVESTMRDGMFLDYVPVLLSDATAEPLGYAMDQSNQKASIRVLSALFGWVTDSDELIRALKNEMTKS